MREYVKTCDRCGGEPKALVGTAGRFRHRVCPYCNGTGQQLAKPIPEGAVVVTPERLVVTVGDFPSCPLSVEECEREDPQECAACLRQWLEGEPNG